MSTTENENAPYTGWSVAELERARAVNRINLDAHRDIRKQIKAELEIAKAREASDPMPVPENPGWFVFEFSAKLTNDDRTRVYTASQEDGRIAVVAGDGYWFFENWEGFIGWIRDPELVARTSVLRPMTRNFSGGLKVVR